MAARSFYDKLQAAQAQRESDLALLLSPKLAKMPLPIARYDDPFLPFGKAIIEATRDLVCAYVFDLAAYLAIGAAGAVALERTIAYAGGDGVTITVLDAPFVGAGYVEAVSTRAFHVDAVTLVNAEDASAYLAEPGLGVYVRDGRQSGIGVYDEQGYRLVEGDKPLLNMRLLGESILYIDSKDDFDQRVRAAVSAERAKR